MTLRQHLLAMTSFAVIASYLVILCIPLVVLAILRFFLRGYRPQINRLMDPIYRAAVKGDSWWLFRVLGIELSVPTLTLDPNKSIIVLANHVSWSDAFVIQWLLRTGPIVKFLCKRELAVVPVIGVIMWAYEFPVLKRKRQSTGGNSDIQRVRDACVVFRETPGAMLTFAEGTRFTTDKQKESDGTYQHLLKPRLGGFVAIYDTLKDLDVQIVDVTISYSRRSSFWAFLAGMSGPVRLDADLFPIAALADVDPESWLVERWQRKDRLLGSTNGSSESE